MAENKTRPTAQSVCLYIKAAVDARSATTDHAGCRREELMRGLRPGESEGPLRRTCASYDLVAHGVRFSAPRMRYQAVR